VHDLRVLREQIDLLRDGMRRRGALDVLAPIIDRGETLDRERRELIQAADERKALRNTTSQEVAKRKRAGEPADELIAQGRALGDEIARLEAELAEVEGNLRAVLLEIPNLTLATVPAGGEENNIIVGEWGTPRPPAGVVPHWEVGTKLGLFDLERASKVSGSGFVFYRGRGARLIRALVSFFMDTHRDEHGYEGSGHLCLLVESGCREYPEPP